MKSESIKELAAALAKAQGQIEGAIKDRENPHFRSRYADLGACWDACREPLASNGLAIVQMPRSANGHVELETMLLHSSGEWISETLSIPVQKQDAQGYGSALTYARRYALCAFTGIAPEDDDGNDAAGKTPAKQTNARPQRQQEEPRVEEQPPADEPPAKPTMTPQKRFMAATNAVAAESDPAKLLALVASVKLRKAEGVFTAEMTATLLETAYAKAIDGAGGDGETIRTLLEDVGKAHNAGLISYDTMNALEDRATAKSAA